MISWKYNAADYQANKFELIPPGTYRVRIEDAKEEISKSKGYPMVKMTLKVSGYNSHIWHYMVFINTDAESVRRTNDNLGRIFDSFNITPGDFNLEHWKGRVGAAEVKNAPDNKGTMRAGVSYFIKRSEQDKLPIWQEHPVAKIEPEMVDFENDQPPF